MSTPESSDGRHPKYARDTDLTALLIFAAFCCCCFAIAKIVIYIFDQRNGGLRLTNPVAQDGVQGLNPDSLEALHVTKFKRSNSGNGAECSICLGVLEEDDSVRVMHNCMHLFHQDCIDKWLQSHVTCPICRANVDPLKPEDDVEGESVSATASSSLPVPPSTSQTHLDQMV
ncbi:RING-H2 finger protein ATL2 [Rhynchospora pubera]|uniref:RING-type E3 ubiquitin transferase n=1 Tax=Rhynchospora pubera TaxID=906938 RepID=A0AAV8ER33_9POAL|nr:RING-H2 finger protein ATL2 [Rhynchospora pubera]